MAKDHTANVTTPARHPGHAAATDAGTRLQVSHARAQELLAESDDLTKVFAGGVGAAVGDAVSKAVGYAGRGGRIETEIEVEHRAADGSQTVARARFSFTRGE